MPDLRLDPAIVERLNRVARFYRMPPARFVELILQREFDRLVDDSPNIAGLLELN
jgi:hypothetical protein